MESSLVKMLEKHDKKNHISFSMPGHKNGRGIEKSLKNNFFGYDVTELADTESMHSPGKALTEALESTAEFFGSDESFILVNGSSSGIFTMLMSCCKRGDKVALNRGCHVSAINACVTLGLTPVFINQPLIDELGVPDAVGVSDTERILKEEKPSALLITSPSFYGFTADIRALSEAAHRNGIPLLADEAHGAHFAACSDIFPKPAIKSGADMCIQSAHKTLNAANQTAFLHIAGNIIDRDRVRKCFSIFQTTSPCYPLMATADAAMCELREKGAQMWERVYKLCAELRGKNYFTSPDRTWLGRYNFADIDECRLVFNFNGLTGFEVSERLSKEFGIDIEMADLYNIVMIPTPSNTDADFEALDKALAEIKKTDIGRKKGCIAPPETKAVMTPSEAFDADGEFAELKSAAGKIAKASVTPYPPGIAALVPGERIDGEMIEYLCGLTAAGAEIHGIKNGKVEIVKQ